MENSVLVKLWGRGFFVVFVLRVLDSGVFFFFFFLFCFLGLEKGFLLGLNWLLNW